MAIVVLQLPVVKRYRAERPRQCPYCEGATFQRRGQVRKRVRDVHCRSVWVARYRCCHCRRTFRHYPEGTSRADQTERLKVLAVLGWRMGLSDRNVSRLLSGLNISLSPMSVWRDTQAQAQAIQQHHRWRRVRVLGLDGTYVRGWGAKQPVLVAVDLGDGQVVAVGQVDEADPHAVRRWLQPLVQQHGVRVLVTDDLQTYRLMSEQLQLGHQVCQFHVRRWVGQAVRQLQEAVPKEWSWVLEEVQHLLEVLPADGSRRLYTLWRQLPGRQSIRSQARTPLEQLRDLLLRLSQHWSSYGTFQSELGVPWTNNGTEQAIGRMKMRARTTRGYKSWPGMQTGLLLAGNFQF